MKHYNELNKREQALLELEPEATYGMLFVGKTTNLNYNICNAIHQGYPIPVIITAIHSAHKSIDISTIHWFVETSIESGRLGELEGLEDIDIVWKSR